jgi:hypothetical protein
MRLWTCGKKGDDGEDGYFQVIVREIVRYFFVISFWNGSLAK